VNKLHRTSLLLTLAVLLAACSRGPDPVHWGVEECSLCRMMISDDRFAGQVMDARGKTWKFDALECMPAFLADNDMTDYTAWVSDGPTGWTPVEDAYFVHSPQINSPMGGGLMAFSDPDMAEEVARELGGTLLDWAGVLARPRMADHGHSHAHAPHGAD
jgi:copper chaperone NosL